MDIIFDIDGTLADITHRLDFVRSSPKNWNAFNAGIPHDGVIEQVRFIFDILSGRLEDRILLASGRSESERKATSHWLKVNKIHGYQKLYMRPLNDYRPDYEIKEEILGQMREDGFDPKICFDDRIGIGGKNSVVHMWANNSIFCFCVNQGLKEF